MANKFQKSVLDRLEEEAKRQKAKQPVKAPEKSVEEEPAEPMVEIAEAAPAEPEVVVAVPEPVTPPEPAVQADIREYLRPSTQRVAKNKTFYLDTDVIQAIQRTAKAQKVTDSKLVGDILRRVLGV